MMMLSSADKATRRRDRQQKLQPNLLRQLRSRAIAQHWLNLRAERSLSTFDQRHLLIVQAQYTSGQGLEGGP